MSDERYCTREFLNLPQHGNAYIATSVTDWGGELTIADCHRQITLDLEFYSTDDLTNIRHKSGVLRRVVTAFLDQVDRQLAQGEAQIDARDAAREARRCERQ